MSSVNNPTYLLAPNWSYTLDGPIALGNIVGDPFRPHRSLTKPSTHAPAPETVTSPQLNWRLETEKIRSVNVSLWTQILDVARFDAGAHRTKANAVAFEMTQLDTTYFKDEPSEENITIRVREPRVRAALEIRKGLRRGAVYMVSGLKVARGFKLTRTTSSDKGAQLGAGGQVAPELSIGGKLEVGAQTHRAEGFESAVDIIFAYQLLRIRLKGKGENATVEVDEFQDEAAFLSDREEGEDEAPIEPVDLETDGASLAELVQSQKDLTVSPDGDQYAWLFPSE